MSVGSAPKRTALPLTRTAQKNALPSSSGRISALSLGAVADTV